MTAIKLIIADDHELFRNGLAELLRKHDDIKIVKSVADGLELMELVNTQFEADIVLLDITMPNRDGFAVLKELKALNSNIKPIVISMHDDGNYIAKCAKMGAYGYLLKNTDESELIVAIRSVAIGKKYFSAEISEKMINFMSEQSISENILSNKETEVLGLIAKGLTTKEIAAKLFVSSRTIETHRANILKKLEVKNTAELIKKAAKMNLV
ncbi:two component transcriptional regulator, LuxR family [Flavobacterium glycines]|uniref:DNA-binding response regulator n=1 Tax=Flavobacterium glycines TaxID=551990 RepID=A0A1B9DKT7_9FLAO|nr:response regulator transcription factor [Flavobacterium glycines]OCB70314.1 DNA-binding response regulator [Flavobacterium glycines]GEL11645.1 oxygen regulatory protein NreC [Flavobacterium glycines]SDJ71763.1 two component transcriptional regulator, LuxR family [Flavobacterium glycines]